VNYDTVTTSQGWPGDDLGQRYWRRIAVQQPGTDISAFFTTKAHGTGMGLPISRSDHRVSWRSFWAPPILSGAQVFISLCPTKSKAVARRSRRRPSSECIVIPVPITDSPVQDLVHCLPSQGGIGGPETAVRFISRQRRSPRKYCHMPCRRQIRVICRYGSAQQAIQQQASDLPPIPVAPVRHLFQQQRSNRDQRSEGVTNIRNRIKNCARAFPE